MKTNHSHPLLKHWLLLPAAPELPLSNPSWLLCAKACRIVQKQRTPFKWVLCECSGLPHCTPESLAALQGYVRLESSIGAVDEVPVADLLQNQQGTRLMTLRETHSNKVMDNER